MYINIERFQKLFIIVNFCKYMEIYKICEKFGEKLDVEKNPQIQQLLGINQNSSTENIHKKNIYCPKCTQYETMLNLIKKKAKQSFKRQKKLKSLMNRLQMQNSDVMESTDSVVKQFEQYIIKLQDEILQRDQIINKLTVDMEYINTVSDNLQEVIIQQKEKIRQVQTIYREQISMMDLEVTELKNQILRQISQKAKIQRKTKQENRKKQTQLYTLTNQIKTLQQQITNKQNLIKSLSTSNNQLRVQLIQLKFKTQIQDTTTWTTDRRISFHNYNQDNKFVGQINKQNQHLKQINEKLRIQLNRIIQQTQQFQEILVSTKLERDFYKQKLQPNEKIVNQNKGFGSIRPNFIKSSENLQKNRFSRKQIQSTGKIKFNKGDSLKTSVSQCIIDQNSGQLISE